MVAEEAEAHGGTALIQRVDVARRDEVQGLVDAGIAQFGRVDALVNNAGIFFNAPFEQTSDAQYDRIHGYQRARRFPGFSDCHSSLAGALTSKARLSIWRPSARQWLLWIHPSIARLRARWRH